MAKSKKKFYAVAAGQVTGIYEKWSGTDGAEVQVKGFPGARYKGFSSLMEAQTWITDFNTGGSTAPPTGSRKPKKAHRKTGGDDVANWIDTQGELKNGKVLIYTDGGCINNPGPGGYGVVLLRGETQKELSGGFRLTTNNRMELTACIEGLKSLEESSSVILYSDSRYVVNGIEKGWAKRWRAKGWMRGPDQPAVNADLWKQLLDLCDTHDVEFSWVKGHAGNPGNERCDTLATQAAMGKNLLPDTEFEAGRTTGPVQTGLFD